MKYMGSKARIAKDILPIILKDRKEGQFYVEPFVGGANTIVKVDGNRIGADNNEYLIELYKKVLNGFEPPKHITKDIKDDVVKNMDKKYEKHFIGYVRLFCTFGADWNGGYAGLYPKSRARKDGTIPSYQQESWRGLKKDIDRLRGVSFIYSSYKDLEMPTESIIYCDPPYDGTTKYKDEFNHRDFWEWCRGMTKAGHKVFVSEYNAPDDFKCIWEKELTSQLCITKKGAKSKASIEKLFVYAD